MSQRCMVYKNVITLSYRKVMTASVVPLTHTTPLSQHLREAMLYKNIAYINRKKIYKLEKHLLMIL